MYYCLPLNVHTSITRQYRFAGRDYEAHLTVMHTYGIKPDQNVTPLLQLSRDLKLWGILLVSPGPIRSTGELVNSCGVN